MHKGGEMRAARRCPVCAARGAGDTEACGGAQACTCNARGCAGALVRAHTSTTATASSGGRGGKQSAPAEPALTAMIYPILQLRELDTNLYQGADLWRPRGARGVFGGQVVSQALVAATKTVEDDKQVHSLHSYFLLAGDPTVPITYTVQRMRDGRSFTTRSVVASQRGRPIYFCMASFHVEEFNPMAHQYPMPTAIDPDTLPDHSERMKALLDDPRLPPRARKYVEQEAKNERPIDIRYISEPNPLSGPTTREPRRMVWLRARGNLGGEKEYQTLHRCVVAYASDFMLLGTALLPHGGHWYNPRVKMTVSLDHSMWFHAPFRADEWMLYVLESPRLEGARSLSFGRLYTRSGVHAVSVAQEGLVRTTRAASSAAAPAASGSGTRAATSASATATVSAPSAQNVVPPPLPAAQRRQDRSKL